MSKYDKMSFEEWAKANEAFLQKYKAPRVEPIKVLNLIMRREFAEAILKGEKKVEVRWFSNLYFNRLTDKNVDKWMTEHRNDKSMDIEAFEEFMCATRPVGKIHFHNYNNSWFLDVECLENALIGVTRSNVTDLQQRYNFHEWDEMLAEFEKKGDNIRPLAYYFGLGKIIDTNLKL